MTKKRNLFSELSEGFKALAKQRLGKRTLRAHLIKAKAKPHTHRLLRGRLG